MSLAATRPVLTPMMPTPAPRKQLVMKPRPTASPAPSVKAAPVPLSTTLKARPSQSQLSSVVARQGSMPPPSLPRRDSVSSNTSTPTATSSTASLLLVPGKDTSSSAGKVFAKPSKEWVLPERAKPGRKVSAEEPDNRRQSQNRISQRAHRARKTDYVQTLEDRLRAYEADEIHSNVRLQEVARALKADNERLKIEVANLRGKVQGLEADVEGSRAKDEEINILRKEIERMRKVSGERAPVVESRPVGRQSRPQPKEEVVVRPSRNPNNRPVVACPICPDPDPDCPCQQTQPDLHLDPTLVASAVVLTSMTDNSINIASSSANIFPTTETTSDRAIIDTTDECNLCDSADDCLCRSIPQTEQQPILPSAHTSHAQDDACGLCTSSDFCACRASAISASPPRLSSSAAVPLRLRRNGIKSSIWALEVKTEAVCSGDPSNCDACRNDSFGQEFCARLAEATAHPLHSPSSTIVNKCPTCPGNCMAISSLITPPSPEFDETEVKIEPPPVEVGEEMMRCDEAWKAIKAHPKATFSSLAMLADVVARRTKCVGPRVELSPPPDHSMTMGVATGKRRLEVERKGVRDALRMLDGDLEDGSAERGDKRRRIEV